MVFVQQKRKYMWLETQIQETTEKKEASKTLNTLELPETPEKCVTFGSKTMGKSSSHTILHYLLDMP